MGAPKPTIFIVDDDDLVRDALRTLLKSAGFKVLAFESAQAFLNSGHHQAEGLLVLDVRMPGMNGLELQRHLADKSVAMPIIFISVVIVTQIAFDTSNPNKQYALFFDINLFKA